MGDINGAEAGTTEVRRLDDRLGLAVCRVPLSGRTLVTYARDHVAVRTPSKPDLWDGNSLDLMVPPAPGALAGWLERFGQTIARLGVEQVQLRWEQPLERETPAVPALPDVGLVEAAGELGLELSTATVLLLGRPVDPGSSIDAVRVPAPSALAEVGTDRLWHAAGVLYRYRQGDEPRAWSAAAKDAMGDTAWSIEIQRELARARRAQVWIATRHGGPAARVTVFHDRQGLAVVDDLIVHPVHRGRGIATALTHQAVAAHLAESEGDRVGVVVAPGSTADRALRRIGFRPHATVFRARRGAGSRQARR